MLRRRVPALSSHTLNAELAGDYGLTCGGTAEMVIEPVYPDPVLAAVYSAAASAVARGDRGMLGTGLDWSAGVVGVCRASAPGEGPGTGEVTGFASPALRVAIERADPHSESPDFGNGLLVEPISGKPRLVVFGGGHVGARLAQAASFAGWRVTVVDDRPEFADATRLPFVERAMVCDFHDVAAAVPLDPESYVVIATRGHQHDVVLAGQLVPRTLRYSRNAREPPESRAHGQGAPRLGNRRRSHRADARAGRGFDRRRYP